MKFHSHLIAATLAAATSFTGFGATPSKPDFAYPKTVSQNALTELKAAMKAGNGPQTVRSLMNYGLAQGEINPDSQKQILERFAKTQKEVKNPATKAMLELVMADIKDSDSLATVAITEYDAVLKATPSEDWKSVIIADPQFFPTLYDFAVARSKNDSVRAAAMAYDAKRPYPLVYLMLQYASSYQKALDVYRRFEGQEAATYTLARLGLYATTLEQRAQVLEFCRKCPTTNSKLIAETEAYVTRPRVEVNGPAVISPDSVYRLKIYAQCLNELTITVKMTKPQASTVETRKISLPGSGVFSCDTTVELRLPKFGEYTITPSFKGMTERRWEHDITVNVTNIMLAQRVYGKDVKRLALAGNDGRELNDVEFSVIKNEIHGSRGNDRFTPAINTARGYEPSNSWNNSANLLTDRAIYHPGDTLRFAATLMRHRPGSRELDRNRKVDVVLRNANYRSIDTIVCTSDDYGRIHGAFPLPSEGLTGRFTVNIPGYTSQSVMVTDYKAPTFDVELNATRLSPTEVELSGTAMGYNGFPIADAQVAIAVNELPHWVWFRDFRNAGEDTVAADTVSTTADGTFRALLTVPADVNLSASVIASSPTGESHDASCFLPRKRYFISADIPEFHQAGTAIPFRVLDSKGNPANVPCTVALIAAESDSLRFTPNADWTNIPSGEYEVEAVALDADTLESGPLYIYRPDDKMPPLQTSLFVPEHRVKSGEKLLIGTSYADSHILYILSTPDSIIEQRWLTPKQGISSIAVSLPDGVNDATITLFTLHNYQFEEEHISVTRPDVARNLKIKVESLRDKVTPGQRETWTIRVTDNLGAPVSAAVMLDVYSKALDALEPFHWNFYAPSIYYGKSVNFHHDWRYFTRASASREVNQPSAFGGIWPKFETYGQSWPGVYSVFYSTERVYGARMMKSAMIMNDMAAGIEVAEAAKEEAMDDADQVLEECVVVSTGAVITEDKGADGGSEADAYRLPEVAVAMWQPVLTTDADGTARIEFIASNANTTWSVNALAYNSELLSGLFGADIISSKPVMVQPQLPRFLRMGDHIELRASVMNNTDSVASIGSFIELYNPATEEVITSREFADTLAAKSAAMIAMQLDAPNLSMIGVRVRATSGSFTDGEQSILPILPNEVTVRTGRPLFLPADSTETTVSVPRGGVMTFTANAIWECVASLPGLQTSQSRSALSSASIIFSAATARGLLRRYPEIGQALHKWQQEDSVLVSRLERNEDLKIALLSATPWEGAAQSETEQRARLLLLFDRKRTDKTISDATTNLARLVRKGGLAWTADSDEPSLWVTVRVLSTLGQLKRMGFLPSSKALDKIIREALTYVDNEVARTFAKDKKALFPDYVMMRSQFADVRQSAPARRAGAATVQYLVGHWRDLSTEGIARAAIILHENGYANTSLKLIESLRQHEVWNYRAISPLYLEAFHIAEPDSPEVDEIRSAYIARKQSMDWGEGPAASDLIAAILNSGSNWLIPAENELSVKVNDVPVNPATESVLGQFRLNLPEGGTVSISKGRFPAWGGVFSSAPDSIKSVEAFASDELRLTRTISGEMKVGAKITVTLTIEADRAMDYVVVRQPRCAAFEPVDQLPSTLWLGYLTAYREPCATVTNWFFNRLAKGTTTITESYYVTAEGTFALAPAEAQSQYAPEFQAHSSGEEIQISE